MKKKNKSFTSPDWKNPANYEHLKERSLEQWAWEFLRRNPKYIQTWEDLKQRCKEKGQKINFPGYSWGLKNYLDPNCEHENISFIPPGDAFIIATPERLIELGAKDPGHVTYSFNLNYSLIPQLQRAKERLLSRQQLWRKGKLTVIKKIRRDYDGWILLLRVLDAIAADASPKKIAEELVSPPTTSTESNYGMKKVYDLKKRAIRYSDIEYRFIPYSDQ